MQCKQMGLRPKFKKYLFVLIIYRHIESGNLRQWLIVGKQSIMTCIYVCI